MAPNQSPGGPLVLLGPALQPLSDGLQPPAFGPGLPVYPQVAQVVRTTGVETGNIYRGFVQQVVTTTLRDREDCFVIEPNSVTLANGYYVARLVGSYIGSLGTYPLYIATASITSTITDLTVTNLTVTNFYYVGTQLVTIHRARLYTEDLLASYTRTGNTITETPDGSLANIDSVAPVVGDRILFNPGNSDTGIYSVTSLGGAKAKFILDRVIDMDTSAEVLAGLLCIVTEGTVYADSLW